MIGNVVAERVPTLLALAVVCSHVVMISLDQVQEIVAHLRQRLAQCPEPPLQPDSTASAGAGWSDGTDGTANNIERRGDVRDDER